MIWATATEKDNDKFVVERSQQEVSDFKPIASVKGGGTTQNQKQYKFTDHRPVPGTSYYRLKQVDIYGKINYSPVVAVNRPLGEPGISAISQPHNKFY